RLGPGLPQALSTRSTHRESLRERPARLSLRAQLDFVVMLVTPYCRRLRGWSPTAHQKPPPQMHSEEPSAEALGSKSRTRQPVPLQDEYASHQSVRQAAPQPGAQGDSTSETNLIQYVRVLRVEVHQVFQLLPHGLPALPSYRGLGGPPEDEGLDVPDEVNKLRTVLRNHFQAP